MLMSASPASRPAAGRPGQVTTWALIHSPPQARAIIVAGRRPSPARAGEVMINESAARILGAHVGSVIQLRGFRPDQVMQVLNNQVLHPTVTLPDVRVTAIIRTPTDLGDSGAPSDVTFAGTGSLFLTAAFYHRFAGSVGNMAGLSFHLDRGLAGLPAFRAEVNRLTGGRAQLELGSDDATAAAAAQRGTSLQALALLLFGIIVAVAMLVIVAQSIARLAYTAADDFPVLRALGSAGHSCSRSRWLPGRWSRRPGWRWPSRSPTGCRCSRRSGWPARPRSPRVLLRRPDPARRRRPAHAAAGRAGRAVRAARGAGPG